ncbi:hypothetical protein [Pantoea stewartii]|uniref:hypothetical protein n=1 Tax=Pantoea stewartii TaxID=66269 RepID=UPI0016238B3C|nr:hypothetical protein [Pantoea stewartii]MBC0852575.1 hypothetical protein [Pantoea stewartii]
MKRIVFILAVLATAKAAASGFTMQCGNFTMKATLGEMSQINGQRVTSQKITELGKEGLRVQMTLMPASDGNDYGFEYVHPDGSDSRFLNVELIRTNMDQPRLIGTFPCQRIAG